MVGLCRRCLPVQVQRGLRNDGAALVGAQPARRAHELFQVAYLLIANAFCCPNTVSRVDLTDRRPQNCIFGLGGLSFEFFSRSASRRDVNSSRCGYMSLPSPTASGVAVGNNKTLWLPGITGWQAHPYTLALRPPFEKSVLTAVSEIPSPGVVCQL